MKTDRIRGKVQYTVQYCIGKRRIWTRRNCTGLREAKYSIGGKKKTTSEGTSTGFREVTVQCMYIGGNERAGSEGKVQDLEKQQGTVQY